MSESEAIARARQPGTVESLAADLRALGVRPGLTVIVHSSLSALGYVISGAPSVILALEAALGETGTLVMPTHSADLSDPAEWRHPPVPSEWWETIRQHMPAFDPDLTPTRDMGAIPECFRKQAETRRSRHPKLSFAARGPHAEFITAGHSLGFSLGDGSPLARVYDLEGWVLLLGVGHANNTSLHLAEYRVRFPGRHTLTEGAPILVDGLRRWVTYTDLDWNEADFEQIGADFARETGQERSGRVAQATARFMPQRALVDFGADWMARQRGRE